MSEGPKTIRNGAMKDLAEQRSTNVAPPAPMGVVPTAAAEGDVLADLRDDPTATFEPANVPGAAANPVESNKAPKKTKTHNRTAKQGRAPVGYLKGSKWELNIAVTSASKQAIREYAEENGLSLSVSAMTFIRRTHKELRNLQPDVPDDGFAPIERTVDRRTPDDEARQSVTMRMSEAEAIALGELREEAGLSFPLLLEEAVTLMAKSDGELKAA